jgi:glycosyltransferase involved in cell wall biosynthesis
LVNEIFFSVIIPTFNRSAFVTKAIDSVLAQTFIDFELIVVDDGSTDETECLLNKYSDKRITVFKQDNKGVSSARNRGIEVARGEWVAFLDSDDWWDQNKLQITCEAIHNKSACKFFHTQEIWYRHGVELKQKSKHLNPTGDVYAEAVRICSISASTAVIHNSILKEIGVFDESFEACEDYDLWLRITAEHPIYLIKQFLTFKEGGREDQLSARVWGLDRFRVRALVKILESEVLTPTQYDLTYTEFLKKVNIVLQGAEKRKKVNEVQNYKKLLQKFLSNNIRG